MIRVLTARGYTLDSLADACGVCKRSIERWLYQGNVPAPSPFAKLLAVFDNDDWRDRSKRLQRYCQQWSRKGWIFTPPKQGQSVDAKRWAD